MERVYYLESFSGIGRGKGLRLSEGLWLLFRSQSECVDCQTDDCNRYEHNREALEVRGYMLVLYLFADCSECDCHEEESQGYADSAEDRLEERHLLLFEDQCRSEDSAREGGVVDVIRVLPEDCSEYVDYDEYDCLVDKYS